MFQGLVAKVLPRKEFQSPPVLKRVEIVDDRYHQIYFDLVVLTFISDVVKKFFTCEIQAGYIHIL